jgi:hypothetical protein
MTDAHFANSIAGIGNGEKLRLLSQSATSAQQYGNYPNISLGRKRELHLDTKDQRLLNIQMEGFVLVASFVASR